MVLEHFIYRTLAGIYFRCFRNFLFLLLPLSFLRCEMVPVSICKCRIDSSNFSVSQLNQKTSTMFYNFVTELSQLQSHATCFSAFLPRCMERRRGLAMKMSVYLSRNGTFSLAVTAEALRANICSKSAISLQRWPVGRLIQHFRYKGSPPNNHSSSKKARLNDSFVGL